MRILYVTQVALDQPSGGSRHVLSVVREIAELGHDVTLVAPGTEGPPGVRRLRAPRLLGPGLKLELAQSLLVAASIARRRPDIAFVRMSASSSAVSSVLSAAGVPIVLELNGPVLDEMRRLGRPPGIVEASRLALTHVVSLAKSIVVTQPSFGEHARQELNATEIIHLPNGADLRNAQPGSRDEAKRELGLPIEQRVISHVGTLAPELRLDLLAEAHRKLPGVALLFVGDGAQQPFVNAMILAARPSAPVLAMGRRPHAVALNAIRAAHVCIDARDGCIGSKSLEYAAMGRRQVMFDTEGAERLADVYPDLSAVHLVRTRSAGAIRDAIEVALEAESRLGPLPSSAIADARSKLGWDRNARELVDILGRYVSPRSVC